MKDYYLWEKQPAEQFWDAHYLGNGSLGMSVMGDPVLEEVYINEDTLWSGSEGFYLNPQHYDRLWKQEGFPWKEKGRKPILSLIMIWRGAGWKPIFR